MASLPTMSLDELSHHSGAEGGSIYIGLNGKVYDVSSGRGFYGPGGGYSLYAGRDATRSLATSDLKIKISTSQDSFADLSEESKTTLRGWIKTYERKYPVVAHLDNGRVEMPEDAPPADLCSAVDFGDLSAALEFLARGADINSKDSEGNTPLILAVNKGHTALFENIIAHADVQIDLAGPSKETALLRAVHNDRANFVAHLIKAGASVHVSNYVGLTPLAAAAERGNLETMQLLLAAGADVSQGDNNGWTALTWAGLRGHLECVHLLLERGADVNQRDRQQNIALHWALAHGRQSVADLLIARGADPTAVNEKGEVPTYKPTEEKGECVLM